VAFWLAGLQGVKLSDWIAHGLGLPQCADSFDRNGITVGTSLQ
jgi:hypothetical protein